MSPLKIADNSLQHFSSISPYDVNVIWNYFDGLILDICMTYKHYPTWFIKKKLHSFTFPYLASGIDKGKGGDFLTLFLVRLKIYVYLEVTSKHWKSIIYYQLGYIELGALVIYSL